MAYDYTIEIDDFAIDIDCYFKACSWGDYNIQKDMMSNLYNQTSPRLSTAPANYAVYALYESNTTLHKIGKATENRRKMRHRMSLYGKYSASYINMQNYNDVQVKYVTVDSIEKAWALERYCQAKAWERGEQMDWENKSRN